MTKICRTCKIYEHHGFWTERGERYFNDDCFDSDFLLTSEKTAFDIALLRECAILLIVAAVPFSSFTCSYNRRYGYAKVEEMCDVSKSKRMKMYNYML